MTHSFLAAVVVALVIVGSLSTVLGYVFVSIGIAPHFKSDRAVTRVGGVFFFLLCGLFHLDFVIHWIEGSGMTLDDYASIHMLLIHVPQAVAVAWFLSGLYLDQKVAVSGLPLSARTIDRVAHWIADNRASVAASSWLSERLAGSAAALLALIVLVGAAEGF